MFDLQIRKNEKELLDVVLSFNKEIHFGVYCDVEWYNVSRQWSTDEVYYFLQSQ